MMHVAVGIIINTEKKVLITQRHAHVSQGGLWEFPGGKVENGENVFQALGRELHEEIGIEVKTAHPLIDIPYDYADRSVMLHTWLVDHFEGEPHGKEGQPMRWVNLQELLQLPLPAGNIQILEALKGIL